mgnify:CR=1 FL=1
MTDEIIKEIVAIANDSKARIDKIVDRVKKVYFAGYKAGSQSDIVWHKVANGDFPEEDSICLVCCDNGNGYKYTSVLKYGVYDEELHWLDDDNETFDDVVIAWCELPRFEEE